MRLRRRRQREASRRASLALAAAAAGGQAGAASSASAALHGGLAALAADSATGSMEALARAEAAAERRRRLELREAESRRKRRKRQQQQQQALAREAKAVPTVVIVGAGLAGLAAAHEMKHRGVEVILVEARGRVGGRVHAAEVLGGAGRADLGASFIHGIEENPIAQLAARYERELYKQEDSALYDADGREMGRADDRLAQDIFNEALEAAAMRRENPARRPDARRRLLQGSGTNANGNGGANSAGARRGRRGQRGRRTTATALNATAEPARRSRRLGGGKAPSLVLIKQDLDLEQQQRDRANETDADADADDASAHSREDSSNTEDPQRDAPKTEPAAGTGNASSSSSSSSTDLAHANPASADSSATLDAKNNESLRKEVPEVNVDVSSSEMDKELGESSNNEQNSYDNNSKGQKRRSVSLQHALDRALEVVVPELTAPQLRALQWNMSYLEYSLSSDLDTVSNEDWDADDEFSFSGAHCMVQGGIGSLAENLAVGLDIRRGSPVKHVVYEAGTEGTTAGRHGVEVRLESGETIVADACLMTVPLGVLKAKAVQFEPALPEAKLAAIERLSFGVLNKIVMAFDHVFWKERSLMGYASEKRGFYPMFWDATQASGAPVLMALVSGRTAEAMEKKTDQEILAEVLSTLRLLYGHNAVPEPKDHIITRWRSDPYAGGSYSYVGLDASEKDYDLIAAPVAATPISESQADFRLFFAGEATNKFYPATVHGAFMSGIREARHISSLLLRNEDALGDDHANSAGGPNVRDNILRRLGAVASPCGRLAVPRPLKSSVDKLSVAFVRRYIIHNFSFTPPAPLENSQIIDETATHASSSPSSSSSSPASSPSSKSNTQGHFEVPAAPVISSSSERRDGSMTSSAPVAAAQ